MVFTGANAPTTKDRFPRGGAVHYREYAIRHGVPEAAILVEPLARNTGENIEYTRKMLLGHKVKVDSIVLVSRPHQQRRAYATAKKIWPDVEVLCSSESLPLDEYVEPIGDTDKIINMLVGDTQRITLYASKGFAVPQTVPAVVESAYRRLISGGFTKRLI
jgi:uncharacterized SAM-binding protein YcdF (DUF218 family)